MTAGDAVNSARALVANFFPKSFFANFFDSFLKELSLGLSEMTFFFFGENISNAPIGFGMSDMISLLSDLYDRRDHLLRF